MSARRYKLPVSAATRKINKARAMLRQMSSEREIDLMEKAGAMTKAQAAQARKRLAESEAAVDAAPSSES